MHQQPKRQHIVVYGKFPIAAASFTAIASFAIVQATALELADQHGPLYVDTVLIVLVVAFFVQGALFVKRRLPVYTMLAAPCFAAASAIAFAATFHTFDALDNTVIRNAVAIFWAYGTFGGIAAAIAAVHRLGPAGDGMLRFLLVSAIGIALTIWTQNFAPSIVAAVTIWLMYRHAAAHPPDLGPPRKRTTEEA